MHLFSDFVYISLFVILYDNFVRSFVCLPSSHRTYITIRL